MEFAWLTKQTRVERRDPPPKRPKPLSFVVKAIKGGCGPLSSAGSEWEKRMKTHRRVNKHTRVGAAAHSWLTSAKQELVLATNANLQRATSVT